MGTRQSVPLQIGPMWSSGDASAMPDGYCRLVRNHLFRPGPRLDARPPFVYDSVMSVQGLFTWDDLANQTTRFGSIDTTPNIRLKATSGETWGSTVSTSGTRLTDFANFLGKTYLMYDDGAGNPTTAVSFDGTNSSTAPFTSTVASRAITTYKERLFLSYPRVTVTPLNAIADGYVAASSSGVNTVSVISGGVTLNKVYPTSLVSTSQQWSTSLQTSAASSSDLNYVYRVDVRNNDATYDMPISFVVQFIPTGGLADIATLRSTAVTVGQYGNSGGLIYRVTTAGTTAVGAPVLTTTLGATTADGTAVWTYERSRVLAQVETVIPNSTTTKGEWSTFYVRFTVPRRTNDVSVWCQNLLSTTATPTVPVLTAIDIGQKDGIADGDPRKKNYGWQFTAGDFYYPFVNTETAASSTQNLESVVWTEIQSNIIRAANTQKLNEVPGMATASIMVGGRLLVFKRRAFWQFSITTDPDIPLSVEDINRKIGCISPRGLDAIDDEVFFIGEDEIYRYRVGGVPTPICGDAMREEIMSKSSSTWVESQSTYKMPILAIDQSNREVWVYTQKGVLYCYNLAARGWTKHDVLNSAEVRAMLYNPGTQKMYVSFGGYGLTRLDPSVTNYDTIDNTATTYTGQCAVTFAPIENFAPRADFTVERVGFFHLATASQSADTVSARWSKDRGVTFTGSYAATLNLTIPRNDMPVWCSGPSITVKVQKLGRLGAAAWSISKADAMIHAHRGEFPIALPTVSGTPDFTT